MVQPPGERIQELVLRQLPLVPGYRNPLNLLQRSLHLKHPLQEPHKRRHLNLPHLHQTSFIP
jgi:hypothetical protein